MIGKLGMVMLVVSDMDRSVAFYRDTVGLAVEHASPDWAQLDAGGVSVALHPAGPDASVSPTSGCSMAFIVDDVHGTADALKAAGVPIVHPPEFKGWGSLAIATDPDGYHLQLVELPR